MYAQAVNRYSCPRTASPVHWPLIKARHVKVSDDSNPLFLLEPCHRVAALFQTLVFPFASKALQRLKLKPKVHTRHTVCIHVQRRVKLDVEEKDKGPWQFYDCSLELFPDASW